LGIREERKKEPQRGSFLRSGEDEKGKDAKNFSIPGSGVFLGREKVGRSHAPVAGGEGRIDR